MNITIRLFSISKEIAGLSEKAITLPASANVADALEYLYMELPSLKDLHPSNMYAVGLEYANAATILHEGDIISIIPPVQGG